MVFDLDLATSSSVVFTACMENKGKDGKQVCFCRNREVFVCVSVVYSFFDQCCECGSKRLTQG